MRTGILGALVALALVGCNRNLDNEIELLHVSYDPTRELFRDINQAFAHQYQERTGKEVIIKQSHGGSSSQARAVIDGLPADVVSLALWSDTDAIRKQGLIADNWEERLPHQALPYYSTIVFVVRKGNPKNIRDWPDLARSGIGVITPNPRTSGNGRLSFLAAWGAVRRNGGSDADAEAFVRQLYRNVLVLDTGARGSTVTFAQRGLGDVHLTWENEAQLEVLDAQGALEVVYPPTSIKAEPHVAWVDANVDRKGTREAAEAYLHFLFTEPAQEIIARHHYRPINASVLKKHQEQFRAIELFAVTSFVRDWDEAQQRFFADRGVFDRMYAPTK
jgi:sulfate/thiosulfate transport system substrate-binding protein